MATNSPKGKQPASGSSKRQARPTTQYEKGRARDAAGAAKAVEARALARMLSIRPKTAPTPEQIAAANRGLAANKGKGIQFADQKVDTSNVKDLRGMRAKRHAQAHRPSRGGKK